VIFDFHDGGNQGVKVGRVRHDWYPKRDLVALVHHPAIVRGQPVAVDRRAVETANVLYVHLEHVGFQNGVLARHYDVGEAEVSLGWPMEPVPPGRALDKD
jgi:hypothetical protein